MKPACFLLFTFFVLYSFAQPFQADTFGRVKDPAFLTFIKSRNYELVENFSLINERLNLKAAYVWQNGKRLCIDLNGREFVSKDQAENFHKSQAREKMRDEFSASEEDYFFSEEDEVKQTPLRNRFSDIYYVENGLAIVKENGLYGVYNSQVAEIIPLAFYEINYDQKLNSFSCHRKADGRYLMYDNLGKLKSSDRGFYDCTHYNGQLFIIQDEKGGNYGLWNSESNDTLLPLIYEKIDWLYVHNGFSEITINPNKGQADANDNGYIDEEEYEESLRLEDLITHGMIDSTGKIVLEAKYQRIQHAQNSGYFVVKLDEKYGVISPQNKQLLPYEYDRLNPLDQSYFGSETKLPKNLLVFQKPGGKTGLMAIDGKILLEPVYDGLIVTYIGLLAFKDDLTGLISTDGEIIVPFQKMDVNNVNHGKISGSINHKKCTWDFYGNVVYK